MTKVFSILASLFAFALCAAAQNSSIAQPQDASSPQIKILDPAISYGKPTFMLPPLLVLSQGDFSDEFHITSPAEPPPFLATAVGGEIDLLSPLKLQRAGENELSTLRTILGSVQLGGVAYLAYRHLKKHGFK